MEGGNKEFWYQRVNDTLSLIRPDGDSGQRHPDGTVGTIRIAPPSGEGVIGFCDTTTTKSGKEVTWKIKNIGPISTNYLLTIEIIPGKHKYFRV